MKYRFLLNTFVFYYPKNNLIDIFFTKFCKQDICDIKFPTHSRITIITNDNKITLWNENKFYTWASSGTIETLEGKIIFAWDNCRPSTKMMYKMNQWINNYYANYIAQLNDIN